MDQIQQQPVQGAVGQAVPVAYVDVPERLAFLRKVYTLFGGTMAIWAGSTWLVMSNSSTLEWVFGVMGGGFLPFLLAIGAMFLMLRMTANVFPLNLIGLGVFGVFEGFLTAPLVYLAMASQSANETAMEMLAAGQVDLALVTSGSGIVAQAFGLTVAVFGGLTAYAVTTKKDFSWLGGALWMGFAVLFGIIVLSFFGVGNGLVMGWGYSLAWVILMAGFVLYDTQRIMKTYPSNAAATAAAILFIDFVIMFKYILLLLMRRN